MTSIYSGDDSLFAGATLIIPSVSQASLPQLTVDVLVHSLSLRRLGKLRDEGMVVPMAGEAEAQEGEDADEDAIVTGGIEVLGKQGSPYVFLQQRAPTLQSRKQDHISLILAFITAYPFRSVLLLTSLDSAAATTEHHLMHPLQVLFPPSASSTNNPLKERLSPIPIYVPPSSSPYLSAEAEKRTSTYPPFLPNGGLTLRLLLALQQHPDNPPPPAHATLVYWCAEADNRGDALHYAGVVTYALGIPEGQVTLTPPRSWDGLFGGRSTPGGGGTSTTADIYG